MWRFLFFAVFVNGGAFGCKWVCIDNKNHIIKEYIDSSKFKLDFPKNEIKVPDSSVQKAENNRRKASEIIPEVSLRMPEFVVEPTKGKTRKKNKELTCNSKQFKTTMKEMTKKIKCRPRDTIVDIKYKGSKVLPNKVSTKLCSGVCSGTKTCMAVESKNVSLTVSIQDSSSRFKCSNVMIPEHTKCRCGCDKTSTDCSPSQIFDKKFCKCKCKNDNDYQMCMENISSNFNKYVWNKITCSCDCKVEYVCTTGTDWDRNECKCIRTNKNKLK
ncbi:unnamed protein product [Phaedon cochleariae]|uniref:Uncharacterized protein n=1 Tax=Phaedon cochleariae TaxID=80249 RepID=A0A9P0DNB9_PHACE|nr:unnamed protein product [Phaedon cochleariae]